MPGRDIVVVGASAGGVEALRVLAKGLPPDLPAAVFVVLHVSPDAESMLPAILGRASALPVQAVVDGEPIRPGRIYVAVPDHHLLVDPSGLRVLRSPRENLMRPSVDVLFRSAAVAHGPRVIGLVLTGTLDDGAAGARAIRERGGVVIVQDPATATYPDMPRAALEDGMADHCLPLPEIPALLGRLAREPALPEAAYPVSPQLEIENRIAHMQESNAELVGKVGSPSAFSCPECHGVLWEMRDSEPVRFRCQVGHAYSGSTLVEAQRDSLEDTLWAAVRSFNESASLARRLQTSASRARRPAAAARFAERAEKAEAHADRIRMLLERPPAGEEPSPAPTGRQA